MVAEADVKALDRRLCELAAHIHAATCEFTELITEFQRSADWSGSVVRTFPHWLAVSCGFSLRAGRDLVRVGEALEPMPELHAAFARGELSLDKVRLVVEVATPEDEHVWAELARQLTPSQLARVCRNYRLALAAEDPARSELQRARRGVWAHYGDDGMLKLLANLTPEVGAQVLAVLDGLTGKRPLPEQPHEDQVPDPAEDRFAAHQADALAAVFQRFAQGAGGEGGGAPVQVVVHVDEAVLRGERRDGRCEIENGPHLVPETARRLACEGEMVSLIQRDGSPLDVGRAQRRVPPRMKKALMARDKFCTFPGCDVPGGRTDGHHLRPWILGGSTDLSEVCLLCGFHHGRIHEGAFTIERQANEELHFFDRRGRRILASNPSSVDPEQGGAAHLRREHEAQGLEIDMFTPMAQGAGYSFHLAPVLDAMLQECGRLNGSDDHAEVEPAEPAEPEPGYWDEDDATDLHTLMAELRAEDPDDGPDPPWPEPDATDAQILHLLAGQVSVDASTVCRRMELPISETVARLTRLELRGDVRKTATGYAANAASRAGPRP